MPMDAAVAPRELYYQALMDGAAGLAEDHLLAAMYASWCCGDGVLPDWLGLDAPTWERLRVQHFPTVSVPPPVGGGRTLDLSRAPESADLENLLLVHRAGVSEAEVWLARIVTVACLGNDHLWQDLGLWSRRELTALMTGAFPTLAARNDRDMKWKKFLYKQLCNMEGIYICRAPSCAVCVDYAKCFGPEE